MERLTMLMLKRENKYSLSMALVQQEVSFVWTSLSTIEALDKFNLSDPQKPISCMQKLFAHITVQFTCMHM